MADPTLWERFAHDPRVPEHATLRASYADREVVLQVLSEAYADGRLDAAEFEERSTAAHASKVLGDLPPLLADLVPGPTSAAIVPVASGALATREDLQRRAVQKWEKDRRDALWGFLGPTLICWAIWVAVMAGGFPWPLFVMIGTGINLASTHFRRDDIVASELRRLERRQAKALEKEQRRALGAPEASDAPEPSEAPDSAGSAEA